MKDLIELLKTKPVIFIVGTLCISFLIKQGKGVIIDIRDSRRPHLKKEQVT
jgi:hypothetical protein